MPTGDGVLVWSQVAKPHALRRGAFSVFRVWTAVHRRGEDSEPPDGAGRFRPLLTSCGYARAFSAQQWYQVYGSSMPYA